jgi:hypothetical protein
MRIYHYHPEYNHFICEGIAEPSPLDPPGVWLIPAHATGIEPPQFSEGYIPIFNGESWDIIKDKRGIYYNKNNGSQIINDNPLIIPENCTEDVPPEISAGKYLIWEDEWILKDIVETEIFNNLTPQEKIESLGLTIDDLKVLLGLS